MNTSRGFISPIFILVIIGLIVLGGVGWWATVNKDVSQQASQVASTTAIILSAPTLAVTNVNPNGIELTVEYQNMPKEARSLFLCVPSGGCTEWGVEFSPATPNGVFTMTMFRPEGSTKTMGKGVFTVEAVDFSIGKVFATSKSFTVR